MKNEYKITKSRMMSWAREYHFQSLNITLFVLWGIVGVLGLGMLMLLAFNGGDFIYWYLAVLFVLSSVFNLFFSRFVAFLNRYKMMSKTYGVEEWIRITEFADDEIILTDHTSITRLKYSNIKKIKEKDNLVIIFLNNNLSLPLYKDAFIEGTWEQCKEKINAKSSQRD